MNRSLCALLTCFNRREKTLACLEALAASTGLHGVRLHAVLVDDGSTDGTAQAVGERFPWVQVVRADGALFWCRGMYLAFDTALNIGFDAYLWLNDDTMLCPDAVARLLASAAALERRTGGPVIVVGSTVDAVSGALTYGGERRPSRLKPLRIERVTPLPVPQRCDSMTGNIVLIDAGVARRVGNIDPVFEHSMGDTDYALRADKLGVQVWVEPQRAHRLRPGAELERDRGQAVPVDHELDVVDPRHAAVRQRRPEAPDGGRAHLGGVCFGVGHRFQGAEGQVELGVGKIRIPRRPIRWAGGQSPRHRGLVAMAAAPRVGGGVVGHRWPTLGVDQQVGAGPVAHQQVRARTRALRGHDRAGERGRQRLDLEGDDDPMGDVGNGVGAHR